jgi:two-component sensor histidine kinase
MTAIPENEEQRLAALRRYDILDTEPEPAFDDLTRIVAQFCGVPMATVSLIDHDRQWFKARLGLDLPGTPRDQAFCGHCILQDGVMEVPDALADPRFAANPLVTGDPRIRFYAGAPLVTSDGHHIGALAVLHHQPHKLDEPQSQCLQALAKQVMAQLELRRALKDKDRALAAKDLLLKEVNHRVKNGLQMIGSLMQMQKRKIADPTAQQQIADMGMRIQTLATVHRHLYRTDDLARSELGAYLREVCKPLAQSADVTIEVEAPAVMLPVDSLVPLAMIISELVTNAAKYARKPGSNQRPCVRIVGTLPRQEGDTSPTSTGLDAEGDQHLHLSLHDDGPGLPSGFDIEQSAGLGMKVVTSLVQQLDGTIAAHNGSGACFEIDVKMKMGERS